MNLVNIINDTLKGLGLVDYIDVPVNAVIEDRQGNEIEPYVIGRVYNAYPISKSEAGGIRVNLVIVNLFVSNTCNGNALNRRAQYKILKECEARLYALNLGFESRYTGIDSVTQDARLDMEVRYMENNILKEEEDGRFQ